MSADEPIEWPEVERTLAYLQGVIERLEAERDQYRDWFERLLAQFQATVHDRGITLEPIAAAELRGQRDRMRNARTRAKVAQGKETRRAILDLERDGKSIARTAALLDLSTSYVARVRGQAKRPK